MEDEKNYILLRVFREEEDMKFFTDVLDDCNIDYKVDKYLVPEAIKFEWQDSDYHD
jgi:hypothetical protein